MKKIIPIKYLLGALLLAGALTACDKFEDDMMPISMGNLMVYDDHYTTLKNQRVQMNVLANDTIGSTATVQFTSPQTGTIETDSTGKVYYNPDPNFIGTDSFSYKACLDNNCATANVTVNVVNDTTGGCIVKAFDEVRTIKQNLNDTIDVLKNDNLCGVSASYNTTSITIINPPINGRAFVQPWDNKISYRPRMNYVGVDELTYRITNSNGTATAKVIMNINASPQHCMVQAFPDSVYINRVFGYGDTVSISVVDNDNICPQNGNLGIVSVGLTGATQTQHGVFTTVGTGASTRIIYTTMGGNNFTDKVRYSLCQNGFCSYADLTIRVK